MSDEYDDFEASLLREARRRSSPVGAKARAVSALLGASASASLLIAVGRHLVRLKLWAKSGAGLSTVVAMIGGSAIVAAAVYGASSVARVNSEEAPAPQNVATGPEFDVPRSLGSLAESAPNSEALRVDELPDAPTKVVFVPTAPPVSLRSAPPRPAASMAPALEATSNAASEANASVRGPGQLGRENALVQTAQSALRSGDIQSAFEALDQHGRHFGAAGALASEAEVLRIEALARTGRRPEAEARARALITSHPTSSLVRRVRVILGRDGDSR